MQSAAGRRQEAANAADATNLVLSMMRRARHRWSILYRLHYRGAGRSAAFLIFESQTYLYAGGGLTAKFGRVGL